MTEPQRPTAATIRLPLVGPQPRQRVIVGGAAIAVLVLGAYWWRARRRAASGGVVVDPALGSTGSTGYVNPNPHASGSDVAPNDQNLIMTDAQWGERAVIQLSDGVHGRWDPGFVAIAVGKYLSGEALTQDEATVIRAAIGQLGYPPNDHPINLVQSGGSSPGGTPPGNNPPPPPPPTITRPQSLVAPANQNLYDWSQWVENTYNIHEYQVIDRCKETGAMKWKPTPDPNGFPYFPSSTTVRLG